jgi:hypothetical protein
MASFLSTLFSGGAEREAADRNRQQLGQYQTQGTGYLNSGLDRSSGYLNQAVGAYQPLSDLAGQYRQGSGLYLDALGVNGADGNTRATGAFQAGPGYEFTRDQGLDAINRRRAVGHMLDSGNADIDAVKFGTGLADQTYGSWLDRLRGVDSNAMAATGAAASGQSGGYGSLANLYQQDANNRVNLAGNVSSGNIAANNQQAAGEASGARNLLNAGMGLASLATGGMGGGFGFGSSLGNLGSQMFGNGTGYQTNPWSSGGMFGGR